MTPPYELKDLKEATELALSTIKASRSGQDYGAVNWADLHCVDARLVVSYDGEQWYEVVVSEADHNKHLERAILSYLQRDGWLDCLDVKVRFEW